ncbi:XdhC family protein [Dissulfurirhabdus thermomarina]|uniref:XdhC family protein n=1 Tax=Dissulfurirhabdus thermomarina TaxID=1765737 RepID=UPI002852E359|nr:XdhC/CoxI family protein [Dissulfurirhabdus thermomarina]
MEPRVHCGVDVLSEAVRLRDRGEPCVLCTIVQCLGSSPRKAGARMLVRADGTTTGTIGGGPLEAEMRRVALEVLAGGEPRTVPYELTAPEGGLACGGRVLVFVEPLRPAPHLVILGAGHVAGAVADLAPGIGFQVTVVDDRPEYADPARFPGAGRVLARSFEAAFQDLAVDAETFVLVATRGHDQDLVALRAALRTPAGYIGLLGSRRKRAALFDVLGAEGFSAEDLARVVTPVGLDIGARTPGEIAVSIAAQLVQRRREAHAPRDQRPGAGGGCLAPDGAAETAPSPGG